MVKLLVDTNAAIAIINRDSSIDHVFENSEIYICPIVIGELFYGAAYSSRPNQNFENVLAFVKNVRLLLCDDITAQHYGTIKSDLRAKGHLITDNDIWIGAHSLQYNMSLVTRDAHFEQVKGIEVIAW